MTDLLSYIGVFGALALLALGARALKSDPVEDDIFHARWDECFEIERTIPDAYDQLDEAKAIMAQKYGEGWGDRRVIRAELRLECARAEYLAWESRRHR